MKRERFEIPAKFKHDGVMKAKKLPPGCGEDQDVTDGPEDDDPDDERDEREQATVNFAYSLVKDAAEMDII